MLAIMVSGINHITMSVHDLARSVAFYRDLLGFRIRARWPRGAYFSAGSLWFCTIVDEQVRRAPLAEYTHVAFAVKGPAFDLLAQRIQEAGCTIWQENRSEGRSLYFLDPDNHKLEIHDSDLDDRLRLARQTPWEGLEIFD